MVHNDPTVDMSAVASQCTVNCLVQPPGCASECVQDETGLTPACSACYGGLLDCAVNNCLGPCTSNPGGDPCYECLDDTGCSDTFTACSGFEPPT